MRGSRIGRPLPSVLFWPLGCLAASGVSRRYVSWGWRKDGPVLKREVRGEDDALSFVGAA